MKSAYGLAILTIIIMLNAILVLGLMNRFLIGINGITGNVVLDDREKDIISGLLKNDREELIIVKECVNSDDFETCMKSTFNTNLEMQKKYDNYSEFMAESIRHSRNEGIKNVPLIYLG